MKEVNEEIICNICHDIDPNIKLNCCKGEYHFACLQKWVLKHNSCPLCRIKVDLFDQPIDSESSYSDYSSNDLEYIGVPKCDTSYNVDFSKMYPNHQPNWLKKLQCPHCNVIFENKNVLQNHINQIPNNINRFTFCCNKLFATLNDYQNHISSNGCKQRCFCCNNTTCWVKSLF